MQRLLIQVVLLVLSSYQAKAQGAVMFIGKTVGQAKFIAERKGIVLSAEQNLPDGTVSMSYKPNHKPESKSLDLGIFYTLYFYPDKGDVCLQVSSMPSIQRPWVADTLINRLKSMGFKKYDESTYGNADARIGASFQYERGYSAPDKPLNIHILQMILFSYELFANEKK